MTNIKMVVRRRAEPRLVLIFIGFLCYLLASDFWWDKLKSKNENFWYALASLVKRASCMIIHEKNIEHFPVFNI